MSEELAISRRRALSLLGVAAALGLALPPTVLVVSDAEATTPAAPETGYERRHERREHRRERRHERREHRYERRHERREYRHERRELRKDSDDKPK